MRLLSRYMVAIAVVVLQSPLFCTLVLAGDPVIKNGLP